MSLMLEPSPEQIKEEEIIQNNGFVRLKSLRWLKRFLGRLPNYTETWSFFSYVV